ncbi:LuxR C-terminal-related transcriptional regulator [Caldimonas tepidiphila]|uniref:LuxR C-terminal-related transcriptional regulator n=1 Tax=Caldimonas tepidiphila TaxID=2315841 RepID=UPI000E5A3EAB|nr:LuxR C-terminal-related transcriptional regulator [Caldimonas tepidiphila]
MNIVVLALSEDTETIQALCVSLSSDPWGQRLQAHSCGPAAAAKHLALLHPDVLLLEPSAIDPGLTRVAELSRLSPGTRILLRCDPPTPDWLLVAVRRGACGCLRPEDPVATVARAVRRVSQGDVWFSRGDLFAALQWHGAGAATAPGISAATVTEARLTPREEQVMGLIGLGLSNKEIARRLEISDKTVKTHLHRVYVKLNQSGRYKALLAQSTDRGRTPTLPIAVSEAQHRREAAQGRPAWLKLHSCSGAAMTGSICPEGWKNHIASQPGREAVNVAGDDPPEIKMWLQGSQGTTNADRMDPVG